MKKITGISIIAAAAFFASQASAVELWDPHLRGLSEGLAAGALPPAGVYLIDDSYWVAYSIYDSKGDIAIKHSLDALVEVPTLIWATGLKVLGADYAIGIAQPFDYTVFSASGITANQGSSGAHWGTYNTVLIPAMLSWSLPDDFYVRSGLLVSVADGSSSPTPNSIVTSRRVGSSPGYNSIIPTLGMSWLHNGWNVSMDAQLGYNTRNPKTYYTSGLQLCVDYTVTKKINDKWTAGIGGYSGNQLTHDHIDAGGTDQFGEHYTVSKDVGSDAIYYGIGPVASYQFPGVSFTFVYNHNIYTRSDVGGDMYNVRAVIPLY